MKKIDGNLFITTATWRMYNIYMQQIMVMPTLAAFMYSPTNICT